VRRKITALMINLGILAGSLLPASAAHPVRSPGTPSACSERIGNGGFETGSAAPWVESSALGGSMIFSNPPLPVTPHGGMYAVWMGGYPSAQDTISQTITLPITGTMATLMYWWHMRTDELPIAARDVMTVTVKSAGGATLQVLQTLDNRSTENQWTQSTFNLAAYAGQTVQIHFHATASSDPVLTNFFIDDVSLSACEIFHAYLPLAARNFYPCTPPAITDPGFASQPDMLQINANDAWLQCVLGSPGIVVAIIDTGVDLDHPDLAANLIPGYDYVDDDAVPEDGHGHGSHVAGIAGSAINGVGVVGVAPNTHLLPVRVLDNSGSGSVFAMAGGITYAANNAQILNLSLGTVNDGSTLRDAINYAANIRGRLVIASAGNCGGSNYAANGCSYQDQPSYPGAYSNVMAVAAVTISDTQASFSTEGAYVDIAAPGVSIYNTHKNGGYMSISGTSQAAPHVAGLAALIGARFPIYTTAQVRSAIESTAVDLGAPGTDIQFGAGRINVTPAVGLGSVAVTAAAIAPVPVDLPPPDHRDADFVPGRVLIKFKPEVSAAGIDPALSAFSEVSVEDRIDGLGVHRLRVPAGLEWQLIDQLRALPGVLYAEPDTIIRLYPEP